MPDIGSERVAGPVKVRPPGIARTGAVVRRRPFMDREPPSGMLRNP
jgi:hypothetical protein